MRSLQKVFRVIGVKDDPTDISGRLRASPVIAASTPTQSVDLRHHPLGKWKSPAEVAERLGVSTESALIDWQQLIGRRKNQHGEGRRINVPEDRIARLGIP